MVLGINAWGEPKETIAEFAKEHNLKHRLLVDGSGIREAYGVSSIPANVWVDERGVMVDAALGFDGPKELHQKTKKLVSPGAS